MFWFLSFSKINLYIKYWFFGTLVYALLGIIYRLWLCCVITIYKDELCTKICEDKKSTDKQISNLLTSFKEFFKNILYS